MIINSIFKEPVVVNSDETFEGCQFNSGTVAKQANVFGLTCAGNANVNVKNCSFANKGYSAIYLNSTGNINVEGCTFDVTGTKNPIEGASSTNGAKLGKVNLKDLTMNGICGNNYLNFYNFQNGAEINIDNVKLNNISYQSECIRLSNLTNATATINVNNLDYTYDDSTVYDENWTRTLLCQDYTGDQKFGTLAVNFDNLVCDGRKVVDKDHIEIGDKVNKLLVVYAYDKSYPTDNDPTITLR